MFVLLDKLMVVMCDCRRSKVDEFNSLNKLKPTKMMLDHNTGKWIQAFICNRNFNKSFIAIIDFMP